MGSTIKTVVNDESVEAFISTVEDEGKRTDAFMLLEMFSRVTGESAKMWGTSIIGFGQYHYKSARSRQKGDWMLTGFSPRAQGLTLYIMVGFEEFGELLGKLGKHKVSGGSCLYITKLANVDMIVLEELIKVSYAASKKKFV